MKTSPVKFIRLVGPRYECEKVIAAEGETVSEAEFTVPTGLECSVYPAGK